MGSAKDECLKAIQPPRKPDPRYVLKPPPVRMPQKVIEKIDFTPFGTVMRRGLSSVRGYLDRVPRVDMERKNQAADKKIEFKRAPRSNGRDFDR